MEGGNERDWKINIRLSFKLLYFVYCHFIFFKLYLEQR